MTVVVPAMHESPQTECATAANSGSVRGAIKALATIRSRSNGSDSPRSGTTWRWALVGSALRLAARPPLEWWPFAWIAPIPWLLLIRQEQLVGPRPYHVLWLAGFAFWMGALHWLRLPYWATGIGWVLLSAYLGIFIPLFVALARHAVHRWRVPLVLAVPSVWVGLEYARGHLLGGFLMASLGHSQYHWLEMIQIADLAGAYAVSFLVFFVAACLAAALPWETQKWRWMPVAFAALAVVAAWGYGRWRMSAAHPEEGLSVALIQGSIDTEMKADPNRRFAVYQEYLTLSEQAVAGRTDVDLVIWPETMFRDPLFSHDDDAVPPPDADWSLDDLVVAEQRSRELLGATAQHLGAPTLIGLEAMRFRADGVDRWNSAILVQPDGTLGPRYDKIHPVMFGEYIPLGTVFPWLYDITPLAGGIRPGAEPVPIEIDGVRLAPSICYENILPHLIAGQVRTLRSRDEEPDVLVNLTNDGWFWGSSELDLHLMSAVFRAVECRKPMLVAANTGCPAWIDGDGRIQRQGPRRATGTIVAPVTLDGRHSLYVAWGDWFAAACLCCCLAACVQLAAGRLGMTRTAMAA